MVVQHPMYALLTEACARNTTRFQARQLANVSWALGSLGDAAQTPLLQMVADEFLSRDLAACTDQELANVAWVRVMTMSVMYRRHVFVCIHVVCIHVVCIHAVCFLCVCMLYATPGSRMLLAYC